MKTLNFTLAVSLGLCLGSSSVCAQYYRFGGEGAGPYFRAGLGPSFFQDSTLTEFAGPANNKVEFDTGVAGDAAIGYAFNKYIATDFEVGFVGAEIKSVEGFYSDDSTLFSVPFLVNLTLSLPIPRSLVVPYIGAGVGGSATEFDTDGFGNYRGQVWGNDSDTVFAWQAFAGLRFKLNPQMWLGLGYKYFATDDVSFGDSDFRVSFEGAKTHSVMFTFQMYF